MRNLDKSKSLMAEKRKFLFEATGYVEPILCEGKGTVVKDIDGNDYLDLNAGQFCVTFGHNYVPFNEVVIEQLKKLYHTNTGTLTPEVFAAAENMASINSGDLEKTIFLSTGSEANECALRFAKAYTKKNGVLGFDKGYHGLTLASQGSTMGGQWALPIVPQTFSTKTPDLYHKDVDVSDEEYMQLCIDDLENNFKTNGQFLAAVIMEPVVGVGGMIPIPQKYLKRVRELCDEYNVVLIFDECQCGFGRTGSWFAYQEFGVIPDMVTTAKAMGMGLAVSAVTFSRKVAEKIEFGLTHFSSHQNDPISAAIVSFVINEIKEKNLLESNRKKGKLLLQEIQRACEESNGILTNARGIGLMCAFDLNDDKLENYRVESKKFSKAMQENGVLVQAVRQGRTFRIMPNYMIKDSEIKSLRIAMVESAKEL